MKRKKRWLLISLMAAAAFCAGGCSPEKKAVENGIEIGSEETAEETLDEELPPVAQEEPEDEVKKINFEHGFENGEEYAVITGVNQLGETVWEYKTGRYPGTELDRICEIGIQGDWYYFVEDRAVVVLDRWDGTVVWKNGEYGGSVSAHVFGPDQTLYLCGTYGPAFMAISKDGKTLCRIDHVAENKVFWPYKMEYADQKITIAFNGNAFESQGDIYCIVDLSDYTYEMEGLEEITFSRKDLEGSWLQTDSEDPMLLILRSDGSMEYYNTVSRSNEYSSKYSQKGGSLCLNLVNLDISGVTEVPYKAEVSEDRKSLTLSLSDPAEEYSKLYGMEKNLEGTYQRLSFTQEELDTIKADLGVPDDLEVTVTQSEPYYWSAGGCWLVSVDIKQGEQWVAGASINPMTMEAVRDILRYSGIQ